MGGEGARMREGGGEREGGVGEGEGRKGTAPPFMDTRYAPDTLIAVAPCSARLSCLTVSLVNRRRQFSNFDNKHYKTQL